MTIFEEKRILDSLNILSEKSKSVKQAESITPNMFLSPQETQFSGLIFYEMFIMLFTNTLRELIFRVLKCQPKRKNTILGAFWNPGRHQSGHLERQFSPKKRKGTDVEPTRRKFGTEIDPRYGFWMVLRRVRETFR